MQEGAGFVLQDFWHKHFKTMFVIEVRSRFSAFQGWKFGKREVKAPKHPLCKTVFHITQKNIVLKWFQARSGGSVLLELHVPQPQIPVIWEGGDDVPAKTFGVFAPFCSSLLGEEWGEPKRWKPKNLPWDCFCFGNTGGSAQMLHYEAKQQRTFFSPKIFKNEWLF